MKQQTNQSAIEWKEVELRDICNLITDGTHDKTPLVSKDAGMPLVTSKDLTEKGISFEKVIYITREQHKEIIKRSNPQKGDILYSKIGTIGKPTIVNVDFEFSIKNVALFKLKQDKVLSKYLVFYLNLPLVHMDLVEGAGGGNQKFIPLNRLEKVRIILPFLNGHPDLETQQKIVAILEKAESLKEKRKQAIKLLDEYLKSVFNEMFVGKGFEEVELKEIAKLSMGGTPLTSINEYWENGTINWMKSGDIKGDFVYNVPYKITKKGFEKSNTTLYPKGTVVIALNGQGKTRGTTAVLKLETSSNQSVVGIMINKEKITSEYLHFNLKNRYNELRNLTGDDDRSGLNLGILRSLSINLPPIPLQQKFASLVENVEKLKETQKKSLQGIEQLFNVLMQKAFNGELIK
ncbi:MAG: restriction endonuclease subunit S [Candidatus Pacearchaeota archaeon]